VSPKKEARREKFRKIGKAISDLDKEWRAYRGESPNCWRGMMSYENGVGVKVMQIVTKRGISNLERRSLELKEK